jgi:hypothetical protein
MGAGRGAFDSPDEVFETVALIAISATGARGRSAEGMDVRNEALNICGEGAAILSSCTDGVWSEFIVGEYEVALSLKECADTSRSTTCCAGTGTTFGRECS